jgi:hypothetical protein
MTTKALKIIIERFLEIYDCIANAKNNIERNEYMRLFKDNINNLQLWYKRQKKI